MTIRKHIATAALALAAAGTASAGSAYFDVVTGQAHEGVEIMVTVQQSDLAGYDYEFVIENNTQCGDAIITGFYFESGWASYFSSSPFDRNLNLGGPPNFVEGAVTPDIAGWTSSLVSYEVMDQGSMHDTMLMGVESGRTATVAYVAAGSGVSLEDLDNALASQGYGIGLRLQGYNDQDHAETAWALAGTGQPSGNYPCHLDQEGDLPDLNEEPEDSTPVPTPSAALMGLALLGLAAKRRRRDV